MKKTISSLFVFAPFLAFAQSPARLAAQKLGYVAGVSFTFVLFMIAFGLLVYGLHRAIKRRRAFNLQK
jgi:hypothetical protein